MNIRPLKAPFAIIVVMVPVVFGFWHADLALAEPEKFDWRVIAEDVAAPTQSSIPESQQDEPNPVVLPAQQEEPRVEPKSDAGWHWIKPKVADNPGSGLGRTAVQLAESEQERDLAQRQTVLDGILPGHLSGLAPLAVESGIEYRF